jgi:hypothetical protein
VVFVGLVVFEALEAGLDSMKKNQDFYKRYNPKNGWGSYDNFIPWVERYISACKQYPDATVNVWR